MRDHPDDAVEDPADRDVGEVRVVLAETMDRFGEDSADQRTRNSGGPAGTRSGTQLIPQRPRIDDVRARPAPLHSPDEDQGRGLRWREHGGR